MPSPIIVGYDGRDHASDALALGQLLARRTGARLVVVCAYPDHPLGEGGAMADLGTSVREDAEAALKRAQDELGSAGGLEVELHALAGEKPSQVLHELAEREEAMMIVLGATHHGAAVRLLTGSTPQRVLDGAPCPVAVAPQGYAAEHGARTRGEVGAGAPLQIAIAFDESAEAAHALDAAAALARAAHAKLRVVTAVNTVAGMYPPLDAETYEEIAQLARETARERVVEAIGRLEGLEVDADVLDGDPVQALLRDAHDDDLLFTGSSGKGTFRRVLMGSVSTSLMRAASCPVVVVPRGSGEHPS
jgi:nucleotide-binding universal stress UspA family protein